MESLPILDPGTIKFRDWTFVSEGTHAEIYRVRDVESGVLFCIKIYRKGWMTPFNLEKTAYERLRAGKVENCVPLVYGYGFRTLSAWGFPEGHLDKDLYYAIVMEWLEGGEQLSTENITLEYACSLLEGLSKIHQAGVLHYDMYRRNIVVVPQQARALWIDFSCAHVNEEYAYGIEMQAATGVILELVRSQVTSQLTFASFWKAEDAVEPAK